MASAPRSLRGLDAAAARADGNLLPCGRRPQDFTSSPRHLHTVRCHATAVRRHSVVHPDVTEDKLILDHVLDHEASQPDRVYLTQPVGGGPGRRLHLGARCWTSRGAWPRTCKAAALRVARASRSCRRTARTSSWPSWPSGWPATPRWRSFPPRRPRRCATCSSTARPACCSSASSTPGRSSSAACPRACRASPFRWRRRHRSTPGTRSSRALRRCRAARRAPPTNWRCSSTPRAPPGSPRA